MNVGYTEYLLPEASSWQFRPSRKQLAAILDVLQAGHWLLADSAEDDELGSYVSVARARQLVGTTPTSATLALFLEAPGGAEEWPDEQPELTAEVCQEVRIIDSPRALIVPAGEAEVSLPCPSCSVDLLEAIRGASGAADSEELAGNGYHLLPQSCVSCDAALSPQDLATFSDEEQIDDVPIFHFCIALGAGCQPGEAWVTADPTLLSSLSSTTGMQFRSMGRWG